MARLAIGRVSFAARAPVAQGLQRYGAAKVAGIPAIMRASETRVYEAIFAHTPVDTGHMQQNLLRTSDIAEVETEYQVLWRDVEFTGQVNPRGEIIRAFYPAKLILGSRLQAARYPSLGTAELEAERPVLVKNLADHFGRPA